MFTGIIQRVGKVVKILQKDNFKTFEIAANKFAEKKKIGDSIAINGTCVTVIKFDENGFQFDAIEETLNLTNLKNLKINDEVNLESALTFGETLDGHLVQGHIDCTGIVEKFSRDTKNALTIKFPSKISKYLAFKGSISINGVSLTISDLQIDSFSVEIIPHTLDNTNFKNLKKGDEVNLEIDLISRYLERLLDRKSGETKYEFLVERNLI